MGYPYPTCLFSEYMYLDLFTCTIEGCRIIPDYCYMKASKHASYSSTLFGARGLVSLKERRGVYSTAREKKNFGSIKTLQSMLHVNVAARKGILRDKDLL